MNEQDLREHGITATASFCSVPHCGRLHYARTYCEKHYRHWRRCGRPECTPRPSTEERFWAKVNKNGPMPPSHPELGPCWLWQGADNPDGYGRFNPVRTQTTKAYRFSYLLLIGSVPPGLELDHLCRNTHCVNPAHLQAVTHLENLRRGQTIAAKNLLKTHCPKGHPYDLLNTYVDAAASRHCRICRRDWNREHYRRSIAAQTSTEVSA